MIRIMLCPLVLFLLAACTPDHPPQALGTVERDRITLTATANEIIQALPIPEGSTVKQGQVLVRLDDQNQQAIVARATAEKTKAEAYLRKLINGDRAEDIAVVQAEVSRAKAVYLDAEKTYRRMVELVNKKLISQSEKDTALAARDSAQASLRSAQEALGKATSGTRIEEIEQARAALAAANAEVTLQTQKLAELTIVATRDGILDELPYHLGERVPVNGTLAVVLAEGVPYARVYVPALSRISFVPGARVAVHVDGVNTPFQGTVRWVAHEPSFTPYYALTESDRSHFMYLAKIDLDPSAATLPAGVPAQVDLDGE